MAFRVNIRVNDGTAVRREKEWGGNMESLTVLPNWSDFVRNIDHNSDEPTMSDRKRPLETNGEGSNKKAKTFVLVFRCGTRTNSYFFCLPVM